MVNLRSWWLAQLRSPPHIEFGRGVKVWAVIGLILAYASVVPLKVVGYLPATVTWVGVVLIPGIIFLGITSILFLPVRTVRQRWFMMTFSLSCYLVGMVLVYWQGWV